MNTPDITRAQQGGGGLFAAVALACVASGITGGDLVAYLASTAIVSAALIVSDALIRRGRAGIEAAAQQAPDGDDEESV